MKLPKLNKLRIFPFFLDCCKTKCFPVYVGLRKLTLIGNIANTKGRPSFKFAYILRQSSCAQTIRTVPHARAKETEAEKKLSME